MKKLKRILVIFILLNSIMFICLSFTNTSNADSLLQNIEDQASSFINTGKTQSSTMGNVSDNLTQNIVGVGQVLTFIGIGVLVCSTTYLGIQYLISPPEKQGEIKEKLTGLAVATIVIFGAWGFWKIAINILKNLD